MIKPEITNLLKDLPVFKSIGIDSKGEYIIFPESVVLIGLTVDNKILLIEQYRPIKKTHSLELPGGRVNNDESIEEAVKRELVEEAGYKCNEAKYLFTLDLDLSASIHRTHVFSGLIKKCCKSTEGFNVHLYPIDELLDFIRQGRITHAPTVSAVLWKMCEERKIDV